MFISDFVMSVLLTEREPPPISQQKYRILQEFQHPHPYVMVQILCIDWKTTPQLLDMVVENATCLDRSDLM